MVFVDDGRTEIAKWIAGASATAPTHIAYGTGTTTQNSTDTALDTESARKSATGTRNGNEIIFETTIPSTEANGTTISELGLLNASTSGTLFNRDVWSGTAKTNNFDIQIEVTLQIG